MSGLYELEQQWHAAQSAYDRRAGEAVSVLQQRNEVIAAVQDMEARSEALGRAIEVLNSYADERQEELQTKVETLVTHGLQTIFGPGMEFLIVNGTKGKLATTDFVVRTWVEGAGIGPVSTLESVDTPVMDARGGGVAAVIGFLLRLVIILLMDPPVRQTLLLDETFAQLSVEYEPALAEFIQELCERTGVQVVMVTHSTAFDDAADVSYRFRLDDGVTKVEALGILADTAS